MNLSDLLTDEAVLAELGERIARQRLDRQLTQTALAKEAGISKRTLERLEAGASVQLVNLVRVCRALGLLASLDQALPAATPSPMDLLRRQGKVRQRASAAAAAGKDRGDRSPNDEVHDETWSWNEDV